MIDKQKSRRNVILAVILMIFAFLIMLSSFRFWENLAKMISL